MDIESHRAAGPPDEGDAELFRLGPPGWEEFAAARRRFELGLKLQGLERAAAASSATAVDRGHGERARTWR
jgi:hypothetical protein